MNQASLLCHKMKIPETLDHLMYCLTKEILCKQPENVYVFAADFFHHLVEERNGRTSLYLKPNPVSTISTGQSYNIQINEENEEIDDFEKELQLLNDDKTEIEGNISPPPTLDESISDRDASPVMIAAVVTPKNLESPRSMIFTSISRPTIDISLEIPKNSEEAMDSFDVNCRVTAASTVLDSGTNLPLEPRDEISDELNLAAIQIQSAYRGHRARREIMVTNQNARIITSSDFVENNEDEFEKEFFEREVKTELEELNKEDKTQETDDNVETNEEVVFTCNTYRIDSTNVENMSLNNEVCNSSILKEFSDGKHEGEIFYTEEHLGAQVKQFVESLTEAVNDPIDSLNKINEQYDVDNIFQTDITNSESAIDLVSEAIQKLSTEENFILDQENYEVDVDDRKDESQDGNNIESSPPHVIEDEFEKNYNSEINEIENEADAESKIDHLSTLFYQNVQIAEEKNFSAQVEEDYQQIEHLNIELPEDKHNPETVQGYQSEELKIHCDDELQDNKPLTEEHWYSVEPLDLQGGNIFPQCEENTTTSNNDIAAATEDIVELERQVDFKTETKECFDSDHSPSVDQILSSTTSNAYDDYFNQPLSSDMKSFPETQMINNGDPSTNTFINDEEVYIENYEAENNSEILMSTSEGIDEKDIESQENNSTNLAFVLGQAENLSNLSDHLADFTQIGTHLESKATILGSDKRALSDNASHLMDTKEQNLQVKSVDTEEKSEIENDFVQIDQDYDGMFEECDQEASNDDEEEIWSKLQKGIELEEQQQHLAAIKIQSTFRGYKTRKDLNTTTNKKNDIVNKSIDDISQLTSNDPEKNVSLDRTPATALESSLEESLKKNDNDEVLSEALAGLTETIATVALFMTDTTNPNSVSQFLVESSHVDETNQIPHKENDEDIAQAILANASELNDFTEESMPNGEEINNIQLIDSYVIVSSIADSPDSLTTSNIEAKQQENTMTVKNSNRPTALNESAISDPEVVFELYVESNETTNDGLLESYWQPKEDISLSQLNYGALEKIETLAIKKNIEHEQENAAATKIQAGYRGYQDRKRVKNFKDKKITKPDVTNNEESPQFTETTYYFDAHKFVQYNQSHLSSIELKNAAATKIQAAYRGNQDRKRTKHLKCKFTNSDNLDINVETQLVEKSMLYLSDEFCLQTQPNVTLIEFENAAATKIQAGYRGYQDRKRVKELKDQVTKPEDVKGSDEKTCSSYVFNELMQFNQPNLQSIELENAAATKIQATYRGHHDRKRVNLLKNIIANPDTTDFDETQRFKNAIVKNDFNECIHRSQPNLTSIGQESAAAIKIQAGYRGHQDRKRVKRIKDQIKTNPEVANNDETPFFDETTSLCNSHKIAQYSQPILNLNELENAAATKIQAGYRGHQDRKRIKHLRDEINRNSDSLDIEETQLLPKTMINSSEADYQEQKDRKRLHHPKDKIVENYVINNDRSQYDKGIVQWDSEEIIQVSQPEVISLEQENAAATKIQAGYRGHQDRKRVQHLKEQVTKNYVNENVESQNDGDAIHIQSDSDEIIPLTQSDVIYFELENAAATKIQAGYRGHKERKRVRNLKDQINVANIDQSIFDEATILYTEPNVTRMELENAAATKIQSGYRGHQDRKRVQHLKLKNSASCGSEVISKKN